MAKQAFGGYQIAFEGRTETMEEVFGDKPITPAQMTSLLWKHVKANKLANK